MIKEDAQKELDGIISKLGEGADFDKIASDRSDCGSCRNKGDLDFFGRLPPPPTTTTITHARSHPSLKNVILKARMHTNMCVCVFIQNVGVGLCRKHELGFDLACVRK
jgi:hypothetical protein